MRIAVITIRRLVENSAELPGALAGNPHMKTNVNPLGGDTGKTVADKRSHYFKDISRIKETLPNKVVEAYSNAYKELTDNWRALETKAQGNIAIAGIFIGGAFAFIQKIGPNLILAEKVGLITALVFLTLSVLFAVRALRVQIVPAPFFGEFVEGSVRRLLEITDEAEFNRRFINFVNDHAAKWQNILIEVNEQLRDKAANLKNAQRFLIAAILAVSLFAASKVVL